eukprot:300210_1
MDSHMYLVLTMFLVFHVSSCAEKGVVTFGEGKLDPIPHDPFEIDFDTWTCADCYYENCPPGDQWNTCGKCFHQTRVFKQSGSFSTIVNRNTSWYYHQYNFIIVVPLDKQSFEANLRIEELTRMIETPVAVITAIEVNQVKTKAVDKHKGLSWPIVVNFLPGENKVYMKTFRKPTIITVLETTDFTFSVTEVVPQSSDVSLKSTENEVQP